MTPGALAFYGDQIGEVLEAHLETGYVFSGPGFLCMGKAVPANGDPVLIRDPWHAFPYTECNAWWLHWIEGDKASLLRLFPHPFPWILYERNGIMRRVRWERITGTLPGLSPSAPAVPFSPG